MALAVWVSWFATHVPWVGLHESVAGPVVLAAWLLAAVVAGRATHGHPWWKIGVGAGFTSALLGLLLVGTRLDTQAPGLGALQKPSTLILIGAFLALGTTIGVVGAFVGSRLRVPGGAPIDTQGWLSRMGIVTAVAITPLLFIGGLVTSTNAGMAVPDWPSTYGANMFFYPLRPDIAKNFTEGMSYTDVFLEHSHRLFGSFIGLSILALLVFTLLVEKRGWVKGLAAGVFLLVCVQGILGGKRVLLGSHIVELDNRWWSMAHGILGQVVFASAVALAVALTPTFKHALGEAGRGLVLPRARLLRICSTGAMHATVLQLIFGAMYRHLRSPHALYSHIGFSVVVMVMAMLGGIAATASQGESGVARTLRRAGFWIMAVVIVQFTLGWVAFLAGGSGVEAKTTFEALIRTTHQANGALFLALAVITWLWARRGLRAVRVAPPHAAPSASAAIPSV